MTVASGRDYKRANPDRAREYNRRSNTKRGPARWYATCPRCRARMSWGHKQCRACYEAEERAQAQTRERDRAEIMVALWAAGADRREIGEALGLKPSSVSSLISRLRGDGYPLPYRLPGSVEHARALKGGSS